jgi:16S rRNA (guanine527-N7)-methyltransferase
MNPNEIDYSALQQSLNVSRETFVTLEKFVELLLKWNEKINLIGRNSAEFVWQKHVSPSAHLLEFINIKDPVILDVGSGAGFPGIILSIIKGWKVVLVERNQKKCFFLKEAQELTNANLLVENKTIEETNKFSPDIITSRGVTTIRNFLKLVDGFLNSKTQVMLMKGDRCQDEINESQGHGWHFDSSIKHSKSEEGSTIVILSNFKRA